MNAAPLPIGTWIKQGEHSVWDFDNAHHHVVIDFGMTDNRELSCMVCTKTPREEQKQWKKEAVFVKRWLILPV